MRYWLYLILAIVLEVAGLNLDSYLN